MISLMQLLTQGCLPYLTAITLYAWDMRPESTLLHRRPSHKTKHWHDRFLSNELDAPFADTRLQAPTAYMQPCHRISEEFPTAILLLPLPPFSSSILSFFHSLSLFSLGPSKF